MTITRIRRKVPPLIIEPHDSSYDGPPWLSMITYLDADTLVAADSLSRKYLWAYVVENMPLHARNVFEQIVTEYWESELYGSPLRNRMYLHEWFCQHNVGGFFGQYLKHYNIEYISRMIGYVRIMDDDTPRNNVSRRKRILVARDSTNTFLD